MTRQEKKVYIGLPALFIALVVAIPLLAIAGYTFISVIATTFAIIVAIDFTGYVITRKSRLWEGPIILIAIFLPLSVIVVSHIGIEGKKSKR